MKAARQRLFTPGDGATPPALTGREREQAVLTRCLADLLGGASPPHDVVLTGPRGNGKTVLLNWFEGVCSHHKTDVDVVNLTPNDIPSRDSLIDVLSPRPGLAKLLPRKLGVAAVGSVEWAPPSGGVRNLRAKLTARCRKNYRELETHGLLPAAVATAPLFQAGADATVSDHDIDAALTATGADATERLAAREALHRLGYIWSPPGQLPPVVWVAGIPSLMTHVLANGPAARCSGGERWRRGRLSALVTPLRSQVAPRRAHERASRCAPRW